MKCLFSVIFFTFCLSPSPAEGVLAQQTPQGLSSNASLEDTIRWLNERLKTDGNFYTGGGIPTDITRFDNLSADGCKVKYQVTSQRRTTGPFTSNVSRLRWEINLADLDASRVRAEPVSRGKYWRVVFYTMGGKKAIKSSSAQWGASWVSSGRFDLSRKDSMEEIAAALRHAIELCQ